MLNLITSAIGGVVARSVLDYLAKHKADVLMENMQGEILEGWVYKLKIAIQEEHIRYGVSHQVHEHVIKRIDDVVEKEFDTRKL